MKKLELWRRRDGAVLLAHDARQAAVAAVEPADDAHDAAACRSRDLHPADHEDTVPAAFYRSAG